MGLFSKKDKGIPMSGIGSGKIKRKKNLSSFSGFDKQMNELSNKNNSGISSMDIPDEFKSMMTQSGINPSLFDSAFNQKGSINDIKVKIKEQSKTTIDLEIDVEFGDKNSKSTNTIIYKYSNGNGWKNDFDNSLRQIIDKNGLQSHADKIIHLVNKKLK